MFISPLQGRNIAMEKMFKMFAALMALLAVPVESRDEKAIARTLKDTGDYINSPEARSLGAIDEMAASLKQVRADLDVETKARRDLEKAGLVAPRGVKYNIGLDHRRKMLKNGIAVTDDETAKRLGAYLAFRLKGEGNIPQPVADIAKSAGKDGGMEPAGNALSPH
jgi:hypothetical protein